MKNMTNFEMP